MGRRRQSSQGQAQGQAAALPPPPLVEPKDFVVVVQPGDNPTLQKLSRADIYAAPGGLG